MRGDLERKREGRGHLENYLIEFASDDIYIYKTRISSMNWINEISRANLHQR